MPKYLLPLGIIYYKIELIVNNLLVFVGYGLNISTTLTIEHLISKLSNSAVQINIVWGTPFDIIVFSIKLDFYIVET